MSNVLIIAPHPDDEALGCFSFLDSNATVLYVTSYHPGFPDGKNVDERNRLMDKLKFKMDAMGYFLNETNQVEKSYIELLSGLEEQINKRKPDIALIPFPSYNQDHRVIHEAALTAMRHHDRNHFVKRILVYEEPDVFDTMNRSFKPQYFRKIDINKKLGAVDTYTSQLRLHRSFNYIEAIAAVRGNQSNSDYAEGFEVLRWCE